MRERSALSTLSRALATQLVCFHVPEYASTINSSQEPIKELLRTSMDGVLQSESDKVALWHPTSQSTPEWQKKALRASRDAKTVVIDPQILENLLFHLL